MLVKVPELMALRKVSASAVVGNTLSLAFATTVGVGWPKRVVTIENAPSAERLDRRLDACEGFSSVVSANVEAGVAVVANDELAEGCTVEVTVSVCVTTTKLPEAAKDSVAVADADEEAPAVALVPLVTLGADASPPSTPVALIRASAISSVVQESTVPFPLSAGRAKHCSVAGHASIFQLPRSHCASDPAMQALVVVLQADVAFKDANSPFSICASRPF